MKKLMMTLAIALVAGFAISACSNTEKKTEAPAKVEKKEDPAHHQPNMNAEVLEPYQCGDVQRLHTLGGVFLASQPQPTDFEQASMGGIKLVVNMRHESEIKDFNEREVVTKYGMEYIN
ncbi:MAG: hypothetical protein KDB07_01635, partial [Planctomycetes bacterium]|nr:hypothetical protein [Planctomycetota bacterium]